MNGINRGVECEGMDSRILLLTGDYSMPSYILAAHVYIGAEGGI
jgi:hypothetical protein